MRQCTCGAPIINRRIGIKAKDGNLSLHHRSVIIHDRFQAKSMGGPAQLNQSSSRQCRHALQQKSDIHHTCKAPFQTAFLLHLGLSPLLRLPDSLHHRVIRPVVQAPSLTRRQAAPACPIGNCQCQMMLNRFTARSARLSPLTVFPIVKQ